LKHWLQLGLVISDCRDERDTPELEKKDWQPEFWMGIDRLTFEELERFQPEIWRETQVAKLLSQLDVQKADIVARIDRDDPVQREILDSSRWFIPTLFPGWFRPEVCFWRAIYERTSWRRPCFERDRLLLQWAQEMEADERDINKAVKNRWNGMSEAERRAICPSHFKPLARESVKRYLRKAKADPMSQRERQL
jgi:hypothetical protein